MAVWAAFLRSRAGLSEVATTTTERFMPSGPKSLSINSLTSLPRSPIRAITLISAFVLRANIPINVDFPTPEPAKIPIRCPFPMVISPSTAFTPMGSISSMILRLMGSGGLASTEYSLAPNSSASVLPRPSNVFPRSSSFTRTLSGIPVFSTLLPGPIPSTF